MLEILGTLVGSIVSGGATGILGVIAQRFADYKNKQLDLAAEKQRGELELAKRDKDAAIMKEEWAGRVQVATVETEGARQVADAKAFEASYKLEPQRYSNTRLTPAQNWVMVLLDAFRGAIRPALTAYLCVLVTLIYIEARRQLRAEDLSAEDALELFKLMLGTICYVWTTITLWWFGTRNKERRDVGH